MIARISFTGTKKGMALPQLMALDSLLFEYYSQGSWFSHGDCVGADEEAHKSALDLGYKISLHPPVDPKYRAYCQGATIVHEELEYLMRNKEIVREGNILFAAPAGREILRSGTWSTIRFARSMGKPLIIITPDGGLLKET